MLEQFGTALAMSSGKNHMLESRYVTNIIHMPKHASPPTPVPLLVEIGERLAATRDAVGLTQQGFADQFGCSRSAIANWEIGRSLPDIHTMMRFCERYEIPLDWVYQGKSARLPLEIAEKVINPHPRSARRPAG
jgi:DNA-binding XRE family transcriptional regulator